MRSEQEKEEDKGVPILTPKKMIMTKVVPSEVRFHMPWRS